MARPGVGTQAFEDAGICRAGQYDVGQAQFGGHLGNAAMRDEKRQAIQALDGFSIEQRQKIAQTFAL